MQRQCLNTAKKRERTFVEFAIMIRRRNDTCTLLTINIIDGIGVGCATDNTGRQASFKGMHNDIRMQNT